MGTKRGLVFGACGDYLASRVDCRKRGSPGAPLGALGGVFDGSRERQLAGDCGYLSGERLQMGDCEGYYGERPLGVKRQEEWEQEVEPVVG